MLRWLLDGIRIIQLSVDNQISRSTRYAYLHEGIAVPAAHAPSLHSVLLAAKMAGYARVDIDGTLSLFQPDGANHGRCGWRVST